MENKAKHRPGEWGMVLAMIALTLFFLVESAKMYMKSPSISGYAALPMLMSILMLVFMLMVAWEQIKAMKNVSEKLTIQESVGFIFSKGVLFELVLMILYCAGLTIGLGFLPCTAVFLLGSMEFFMPKKIVGNLIYTAVILAFVYVVFGLIFRISLP